jgi:hypothetical protein
MIIYTRALFWADGFTVCQRLILIRPEHRNSPGLLAHERTHVRQMQRIGTLKFIALYLFSRKHRMAFEVEAYKTSIMYSGPGSVDFFAGVLAKKYFLNITVEQAREALLAA